MCAIVGAILQNPSLEDFNLLKRVFVESKIRGMHATGISYVKNNKVHIERHPVPADQFPFKFAEYVNEDGNLYLIGHCRYSTSDLEYNQPIGNSDRAIAHNGVISQELPENWKEIYGVECMTKNDSELILYSENPLKDYSHMSMGVAEVTVNKQVRFYRNGKRPLYLTSKENGSIITSTKDIASRAGIEGSAEIPMNAYISFDENLTMMVERQDIEAKDYQHYE